MNPTHLDDVIEYFKLKDPATWKMGYPRRILPPNGYTNPRYYAVTFLSAAAMGRRTEGFDLTPHATMISLTTKLAERQVPTYFVMPDYLQAVAASEPPNEMTLEGIHWPMPAMLFVLPDGFTERYAGARMPFLAIAHIQQGSHPNTKEELEVWRGMGLTRRFESDVERIMIHYQLFVGQHPPIDYTGAYNVKRPLADVYTARFTDAIPYEESIGVPVFSRYAEDFPHDAAEQELNHKMNMLAVKLLLAVSARPHLLEVGALARPAKVKRDCVVREELWHPNLIGRTYRIVREPGLPDGTHASPRMHRRKGHWRTQRHGHGLALTKVIWLDPVLVNAPSPDDIHQDKERKTK